MAWINPVLNWTKEDTYEAIDLNRVENNTEYISSLLSQYGYTRGITTIVKNRTITSYDDIVSINRVESNLDKLKHCFYTPTDWRNSKTWIANMKFDYSDAYRYENNLNLLFNLSNILIDYLKYSGTFSSGQEVILWVLYTK